MSAAIGCAQIEELPQRVERRRAIHAMYVAGLADVAGVKVHTNPDKDFNSNYWLSTITFDKSIISKTPDEIRVLLMEKGIETRLIWRPMHMQPVFADCPYYCGEIDCSRAIFESGLCLPSGSSLTDEEVAQVIEAIKSAVTLD